ncbi:hypothetical protein CYMTET_18548 [Cymbomonas tetramitiformis]|uniref:Uncharacterized protein n=1 Tax=Cymbomonas tetramitiformis TaxID=36881 RepID=A0AAE0G969_9CHLO|nr:hypothetical protein CYMTET_18548 [Cymbomonas tetramitiformis]
MDTSGCVLTSLFVAAVLGPVLAVIAPEIVGETMLGIDLGTTFSVAAVCHRGHVEVVPVFGQNTVPSVVFMNSTTTLIGSSAAALRTHFPKNTIFDAKRLIGRNYSTDELIQEEQESLPFKVFDSGNGSVLLGVPGIAEGVTPQRVGTLVLSQLKAAAEAAQPWRQFFGFRYKSVTISVPVAFDNAQRSATVKAGEAAGFRMVRILEEPIAAAISFGLHHGTRERTVLVFDMGGGTLDVALLRLELRTRTFLIMGSSGDPHLGGEDFDRALAAHFTETHDAVHSAIGAGGDVMKARLVKAVEMAKQRLATTPDHTFSLPVGKEGTDKLQLSLDRGTLKEVCSSLLERAMNPVYDVLMEALMEPDDVDDVVMVGGSSRLVAVREMLGEFFGDKVLNYETDPDLAIAVGSAMSFGC